MQSVKHLADQAVSLVKRRSSCFKSWTTNLSAELTADMLNLEKD